MSCNYLLILLSDDWNTLVHCQKFWGYISPFNWKPQNYLNWHLQQNYLPRSVALKQSISILYVLGLILIFLSIKSPKCHRKCQPPIGILYVFFGNQRKQRNKIKIRSVQSHLNDPNYHHPSICLNAHNALANHYSWFHNNISW